MDTTLLFTPIAINGLTLSNRIIMPGMVTQHAAVNGEVTEKLIHYHAARARGGVGLNIVEATSIEESGNSFTRGLSIAHDGTLRGLGRLASAVHRHGGRIAIQLQHGGRCADPSVSGRPRRLVSLVPGLAPSENALVLSAGEIGDLVEAYALAARRAMDAGFDAVELHGAHGYLISQFLSPMTNRREDGYGGSEEKRLRFPLEVLRAVRAEVGPGTPVLFRLSVEEYMPGGLELDESVRIARVLADNGADMLNVSIGIGESVEYIIPPASVPDGWNADRAAAVRRGVDARVPVAVAGRIYNRDIAESILSAGKADLVAMGRALLADPDLPLKLAEGRDGEVRTCVACNEGCTGMLGEGRPVSCALNPRTGYEADYPPVRAAVSKCIVVVGGGPAGCEAACVAAERGHRVVLFERRDRLGGLANVAALPPRKAVFGTLGRYFTATLPRLGVDVRLNAEAALSDIQALRPDHVLLATGGVPIVPRFCAGAPDLALAQDILSGTAQAGQRVLLIGGGLVGAETAEFLAEQGKSVTMLELRGSVAQDMEYKTRQMLMPRLRELGVAMLVDTEVLELCGDGAAVRTPWCARSELHGFDTRVIALGYRPEPALCAELAAAGIPFTRLGDGLKVGKIINAVWQAFQTAYAL